MPSVLAYHRPTNLDEAAELLSQPNRTALAGGTVVVPEARKVKPEGVEVVDLQSLGLDSIETVDSRVQLGAMVRLGDMNTDGRLSATIREACKRELPSALRNQATIGGTVAEADPDSLLLAALLVHDAKVTLHQGAGGQGADDVSLGDYLTGGREGLIVSISVDPSGHGSIAATGRTPADVPIVAAVACATDSGMRLALTGVASTPIEVDSASPPKLDPPGDFRGSSSYRAHLVEVLSARAIQDAKAGN